MEISERHVVVTGGASGIGRALALRLAEEGARAVVVADRDLAGARAVAERIGGLALQIDAGHEPDIRALVARAGDAHGPIDIYVSNAGVPGPMPAEASDLMGRDWRFSSGKAERDLGYSARPLDETLQDTIDWYQELIEAGSFGDGQSSSLSRIASGVRTASRLGALTPLRVGQRLTGRQMIVGI